MFFLIYPLAFFLSMAMSYALNLQGTPINPDGVCYLLSAETIHLHHLQQAMQLCGPARWPLYAMLINALTLISHLSYFNAAFLLDAFFAALTAVFFIAIVRAIGGSARVMWFALLVILCAYEFNHLRNNVIRDHGFWAMYLASMLCLMAYFRAPSWAKALLFSVLLYIGTLFRIEGVLFLAFLPFIAFILPKHSWFGRIGRFIQLHSLNIVVGILLLSWLAWHPHGLNQLGRVSDIVTQLQNGLSIIHHNMLSAKQAFTAFLPVDGKHDAGMLVWLTFICWYLVNIIASVSIVYALILMLGLATRLLPANRVLLVYMIINVCFTLFFLAEYLFLSKRYVMALSLTLMLFIPFILDGWRQRHRLLFFIAILATLMAGILPFLQGEDSKAYLMQAGEWLSKTVPASSQLYSNDYLVMYYSRHFGTNIFQAYQQNPSLQLLVNGGWQHYNYLALRVNNNDALAKQIPIAPVATFVSGQNRVVIYRVK